MAEFRDLQCSLATDHVVKEPISLPCGHCVCKNCFPDQTIIICKICSIETDKSELLKVNRESDPIENIVKRPLSALFDDLEKQTTDRTNSFKSCILIFSRKFLK